MMADKTYRELQQEAKALGIKSVGVAADVLEKMIDEAKESGVVPDETRQAPEPQEEPDGHLDPSIERQVRQLGRETAEKLRQCPSERIIVPIDPLNENDKEAVVSINGWVVQIQRDQPVTLPVPMIELLERGGYNPRRAR